jgi:hypothetical protein
MADVFGNWLRVRRPPLPPPGWTTRRWLKAMAGGFVMAALTGEVAVDPAEAMRAMKAMLAAHDAACN